MVRKEFEAVVKYYWTEWWHCRESVLQSLDRRFDVHPSGRVFEVVGRCPFEEHLHMWERENGEEGTMLFLIWQVNRYLDT